MNVLARRFCNQRLVASRLRDPAALVSWMGAVQAQEYPHARWGLGLRLANVSDAEVAAAFDDGRILRTHILRPTWHFVAPADIRWMLSISGPRVHVFNGFSYRQGSLDAKARARGADIICRALEGHRHLTRKELATHLKAARLPSAGQHLASLVMHAELEGLICSGPRRGKQFTYALMDERVPAAPVVDTDEALGRLVEQYFSSHGPATIRDFAWWSGLTTAQAKRGIGVAGPALDRREIDGREHWFAMNQHVSRARPALVHLLPCYDEFLIAYRDRQWSTSPGFSADRYGPANVFVHQLLIDGKVRGAWRRDVARDGVTAVTVRTGDRLSATERTALEAAVERLARFLGHEVTLDVQSAR